MGEIADAILDGDMCEICSEPMDGEGYPQRCAACQDDEDEIDG